MGIIVISTKRSARRNPILTEVGFLFGGLLRSLCSDGMTFCFTPRKNQTPVGDANKPQYMFSCRKSLQNPALCDKMIPTNGEGLI